jgi:hypothetical protein
MSTEKYSEEIKKLAYEKTANIKIYQLHLILEIINLASSRGAFSGKEMSHVGSVYDILNSGVERALHMSKEELDKAGDKAGDKISILPKIVEEELHQ